MEHWLAQAGVHWWVVLVAGERCSVLLGAGHLAGAAVERSLPEPAR